MRGHCATVKRLLVPDEQAQIQDAITELSTSCSLVLTCGGTGFSKRDVTPEATRAVLDREAPGLIDVVHADALKTGEHTALRFLFGPVRAALGGHCRLIVSGAAPLPSHVQDFLRATMGCPVVQGYGMTENCAQGTIAIADDWRGGHVGPPMPTVEVLSLIHI